MIQKEIGDNHLSQELWACKACWGISSFIAMGEERSAKGEDSNLKIGIMATMRGKHLTPQMDAC